MLRTFRTALSALALATVAVTATGCAAAEEKVAEGVDKAVKETYEVTYEIGGSGTASVSFNAGKGTAAQPELETEEGAKLPWTKTVTLRGIAAPTVQAVAEADDAEVSCKITHKGKVLKEHAAKGAAVPATCVTVSPLG
ncbi:MmpS family transport accessory protein [Streptomyces sp. UNOC14_S4]|uniref:MmpS family transport accessory protein n=1 Tax=Streptomyces sp. UNOC14_S4 TaxID=2872340 RepID=UPI001E59725C|nr:MmpS family transport accessory protein [Streptomyces sp. UNOC14_S4]MCC3766993.1 MmpS family protein [Streptomyces sp. UNOC14_S4]